MPPAFRVSILINLGQAFLIVFLLVRSPEQPAPNTSDLPRPSQTLAEPPPSPGAIRPTAPSGTALDAEVVAQLERAGLSRRIIVQALLADFNQRWDRHVLDVEKRYAPRTVPDREYIELGRERETSLVRELKASLGEDGYRAWHKEQAIGVINGAGLAVSPEEAEQAYRLHLEFEETHRELQIAMEDGVTDMADAVALQMRARETLDAQLGSLFGKARLDAMRGYTDPVANVYRAFGDLVSSPEQARAVLASDESHASRERALAERLKRQPESVDAILAELQENDSRRDAELGQIFGKDAHAAARRENDPAFKTILQYADAWELPDTQIGPVYSAVAEFKRRREQTLSAAAMREAAGQPVAWAEIRSALRQEQNLVETGLVNLIGDERFRRLRQNGLLDAR